jgi:hypothetical protein
VSTGLGTAQRAILNELKKLPIETYPSGIPVATLARRLGRGERQVRRAVYAMAERGLVALVKQPRPGRQGHSLMVWDARFHAAWMDFVHNAGGGRFITIQLEMQERRANAV